jgi:putative sterol carrier protein
MAETQDAGQQVDFSSVDPEQIAGVISQVTDEQLREGLAGPQREAILAEVFRRMEEHFKPESAQGVDAVVHWKITGRPDGGYDHWEIVVRDGKCAATNKPQHDEARATLTLDAVDFMRLVTGNVAGPMMFMSGKLKIEGDLMFTAQVQSMFRIPGAQSGPPSAPPAPTAPTG